MNNAIKNKAFVLLCLTVFCIGCASTDVSPETLKATTAKLDFGDSSSQTLLDKAWRASKRKKYAQLFAYTQRCVDIYGEEGKKMNAELSDFAPPATAMEKWALNDVGTCLFIMGNAYEELDMYPEAVKTFKMLAEDYTYAQAWDPKGWFWRPSNGAAAKARKMRNW